MSNLLERLRCSLQRNFKGATPSRGYIDVKKGQRFKDDRGVMVTVKSSAGGYVEFYRDGYSEKCQTPLRLFSKKFTEVKL